MHLPNNSTLQEIIFSEKHYLTLTEKIKRVADLTLLYTPIYIVPLILRNEFRTYLNMQ